MHVCNMYIYIYIYIYICLLRRSDRRVREPPDLRGDLGGAGKPSLRTPNSAKNNLRAKLD